LRYSDGSARWGNPTQRDETGLKREVCRVAIRNRAATGTGNHGIQADQRRNLSRLNFIGVAWESGIAQKSPSQGGAKPYFLWFVDLAALTRFG
jgi:hypothetical protein